MTLQVPVFYDAANKVHRPMDLTDKLNPQLMPVSAAPGNLIQNLTDGLYVGQRGFPGAPYTLYVNMSTGADTTTNGGRSTPYRSLAYALTQIATLFPNGQFNGYVTIALQAGQSFVMANDFNMYGGQLRLTFYGDPTYGDADAIIGTGALSQFMADLQRPTVTFTTSLVSGLNHIAGFNRYGGSISFDGLQMNLPAAPAAPSQSLYTQYSDIVRCMNRGYEGYVSLMGSIVNMTDTNSYWGFLGVQARSSTTSFEQYASQFWVNGRALSATASPAPTSVELSQRQYFIKFYFDWAGNNQQQAFLQGNSQNSTTASGLLNLIWADTTALVVTGSKTNLASFPIAFDINYGSRNYFYNLTHDQQQRPLNVVSSRLI